MSTCPVCDTSQVVRSGDVRTLINPRRSPCGFCGKVPHKILRTRESMQRARAIRKLLRGLI